MFANPAFQRAFRTGVAKSATGAVRFPSPLAVATARGLQTRQITSATPATSPDAEKAIVQQRLLRPVAPHLTIYKPQIPWILSSIHRVTGIIMSGPIYLFSAAYVIAPAVGWHLETQSLAAAFATWPIIAKVGIKSLLAFPFAFHCINGMRHLVWDFGVGFDKQTVIRTGWSVVALSTVSALALVFLL